MKHLLVFYFTLLVFACNAQENTHIGLAEHFITEFQSQLEHSSLALQKDKLIGKIIMDKTDSVKTLHFVNQKYYIKTDCDRKILGTYKIITVKNIPVIVLLNNRNNVEGFVIARNDKQYWYNNKRRDDLEPYESSQEAVADAESLIDKNDATQINYFNPKAILYTKNGKIGIKYDGKNIAAIESDSLDIYFNMVVTYHAGRASLFNISGALLTNTIKSFYKYSPLYYQIIDDRNKMFFIDSLGKKYAAPEEKRSLMGNDTDPGRTVFYYIKKNEVVRNVHIPRDYSKVQENKPYEQILNIEDIELPKKFRHLKFVNNETEISAEDYWYDMAFYKPLPPDLLIAKSNNNFGVWDMEKKEIFIPFSYKKIVPKMSHLFLIKKRLVTCYPYIGLVPKFKTLQNYIEYYARFEYPDGLKGWVDRKGVEYFD